MNKHIHNIVTHSIAALTSSCLTALAIIVYGIVYIIQPMQKEAVDKGFAIWEVTNNATGSTKFVWVEYSAQEALAQNEQPLK